MQKIVIKLFAIGIFAMIVVLSAVEFASAQLRVPPTHVAALATQLNVTVQETDTTPMSAPSATQTLPIQYVATPQAPPPTPAPQQLAPPQVMPQQAMTQQVLPQQTMPPGMMGGAIVIPVVVPQYVTYTPPPVTMMVNRPAQLVIPQYPVPMPPMQPMYDPMAMQMMQQQMMMQQMMPMPVMQPQAPPPQPIPVKMIIPDGSMVSIKHYMPGQFFKNALRAVTP